MGSGAAGPMPRRLFSQTEPSNDLRVSFPVRLGEVFEQTGPLADHHEQAATRGVILLVLLEVLGKLADAFGEQGDLNLRRASILFMDAVLANQRLFTLCQQRHSTASSEFTRPYAYRGEARPHSTCTFFQLLIGH